ncbi:DUF6211 family protein, partial [Streptomyces sp. UNOC14_S4]|uniref:DUF6211 family protein n=1 Tax=Streptomyces sp. UNOC14_S4 TaxID=2872340 RepID=UPI001E4CBBAE
MLIDRHPDRPHPGDYAQLKAGNRLGADPSISFVIVEGFPPGQESIVLNLPAGHPGREDWAAAVDLDDVASLTRVNPEGTRTWAPTPDPEA